MIKPDLQYTEEHEWLRADGNTAVIGITDFAQDQLGDIVFVELPEVGATFGQGDAFGVVESVKSVSDLYIPVGGRVLRVNDKLIDTPELVNDEPYDGGWMIEIEITDPAELDNLLTAEQYQAKTGA